jgi:hypothetical protein
MVSGDMVRLPLAFGLTAELAIKRGAHAITKLEGCYEMQIDDTWWCAMNGHDTPTKCSHGPEVTPFGIYFERMGWPAGLVDASGGLLANGLETEQELVDALKEALGDSATLLMEEWR